MLRSRETGPTGEQVRTPNSHLEHGRVQKVMEGFYHKQQLLDQANSLPPDQATALIEQADRIFCGVYFSGGGLGVSTEVGFAEALYQQGFTKGVINAYVGASGGAIVASHSMIGDVDAVKILPEVCEGDFVRPGRNPSRPWQMLNYDALRGVLFKYPLNRSRLQMAKPALYVITVETSDGPNKGKIHAHDLKKVDDPEHYLAASSHIPFVSTEESTDIEGIPHNDGGLVGYPLEFMDSLIPEDAEEVHWLIINSMPIERRESVDHVANALDAVGRLARRSSHQVGLSFFKASGNTLNGLFLRHWRKYQTGRVENYGVLAPERMDVGTFTTQKEAVLTAINDSRQAAREFVIRHVPHWLSGDDIQEQTA